MNTEQQMDFLAACLEMIKTCDHLIEESKKFQEELNSYKLILDKQYEQK